MSSDPLFRLYTYFRSSCSGRLRIACNMKGIPVEYAFINLLKAEQNTTSFKQINPSESVPAVVALRSQDSVVAGTDATLQRPLTQSVAILEYLEEALPNNKPHLLPPIDTPGDIDLRARIRTLVGIISCDLQPLTNSRTLNKVRSLAPEGDKDDATAIDWARGFTEQVFKAFEEALKSSAGKYCVGDDLTLADVCVPPAVWGSQRWGVNLEQFPTLRRVYENLSELDAVKKAHWRNQPDTPESLRQNA